MPRVPDASSVTRLRAVQSSAVADPIKRSASYVPAQPGLLYSLRSTDAGSRMFPGQTTLSNPVACGWVNPRHQGLLTGPSIPPPLPRVVMGFEGVDFSDSNARYDFTGLPPAADFEAVFLNEEDPPTNVEDIIYIRIYQMFDEAPLFGSTTIEMNPVWAGSTFESNLDGPELTGSVGTFPGIDTVFTFRNVPLIENVAIQFGGAEW